MPEWFLIGLFLFAWHGLAVVACFMSWCAGWNKGFVKGMEEHDRRSNF